MFSENICRNNETVTGEDEAADEMRREQEKGGFKVNHGGRFDPIKSL